MKTVLVLLVLLADKVPSANVVKDPLPQDIKTVAAARDAGEAPDYAVFQADRSDGGSVYYGISTTKDGGTKKVYLNGSPCRRKSSKAKPDAGCPIRLPDGGERDYGVNNTIQSGKWVDRGGCEETPCAVFFGSEPK